MFLHKVILFYLLNCICIVNCNDFSLGDLAQVFAALSGGIECEFKCPKDKKPTENEKHKKSSNGCGVPGLNLDLSQYPGFESCCEKHDFCYDTCNSLRNDCDETFKHCLQETCDLEGISNQDKPNHLRNCKEMADMFHAGTTGLGCAFYLEAQRNACLCSGKTLSKKLVKRLTDKTQEL